MKKSNDQIQKAKVSRRDFIRATAAVGMAAVLPGKEKLFAAGSDKLRVGLIGCGGRGTGAAKDCVNSSPNVEIVAMGDVFKDRLDKSLQQLKTNDEEQASDWSSSIPWKNAMNCAGQWPPTGVSGSIS